MALVELRVPVNAAVEQLALGEVVLLDRRKAADRLVVRQHVAQDVDREARWGVVERVLVGVDLVLEHAGELVGAGRQEIVADDGDDQARRPQVLLGAGVDQPERLDVERPPHEIGRHVAGERNACCLGERLPLRAKDRVVRAEVDIRGVGVDLDLVGARQPAELLALRRRDHPRGVAGDDLGLLVRLLGPLAGNDVIRLAPGVQDVHRQHGELQVAAALKEEDLEVVRDGQEVLDERDGLVVHRVVLLCAVGDLHDRHAGFLEVEQLRLGALEGRQRQRGGTGVEVDDPVTHRSLPSEVDS